MKENSGLKCVGMLSNFRLVGTLLAHVFAYIYLFFHGASINFKAASAAIDIILIYDPCVALSGSFQPKIITLKTPS